MIFVVKGSGKVLFIQRGKESDAHPGKWAPPGGGVEGDETWEEAAKREAKEEVGYRGNHHMKPGHVVKNSRLEFRNFICHIDREFKVRINDESEDYVWAHPDDAPEPLHPGVKDALNKL